MGVGVWQLLPPTAEQSFLYKQMNIKRVRLKKAVLHPILTQMCLSSISNGPEKLRQSLLHVFLRLQTGTIYPTRRCSSLTYSALKRSFWNAVCEKGHNNPSALQSCRCPIPRWQAGADDGQTPSPHSADHAEAHLLPFILWRRRYIWHKHKKRESSTPHEWVG